MSSAQSKLLLQSPSTLKSPTTLPSALPSALSSSKIDMATKSVKSNSMLGVGFRPELALAIERREDLSFVEVLAEDYRGPKDVPQALKNLVKRGVEVLVHSVSLSLGEAPSGAFERDRLQKLRRNARHLDEMARYFDAPFVSDHIAFVRSGNLETGHLLPVEHSIAMMSILQDNISAVKEHLSARLVLENIACTFAQPGAQMDEATFVRCVVEQNDCGLLLDLSNVFANAHNLQFSAAQYLQTLPLERLVYVHLAGGTFKEGLYHDTHCHPLQQQSLELLSTLRSLVQVPRVMLERDDSFPPEAEFNAELSAIQTVLESVPSPTNMPSSVSVSCGQLNWQQSADITSSHLPQSLPEVAARQYKLTSALLGLCDAPQGFDAKRISAAALALSRKRLRSMKRAHPLLSHDFAARAKILTDPERDLERALLTYFCSHPGVHADGPHADALAFLKQVKMVRK